MRGDSLLMNRKKTWRQRVLVVIMALSVFCSTTIFDVDVLAKDSAARFTVSDANVAPGDTVCVSITLYENPGLVATLIRVNYDKSVLTLTGIENGTVFDEAVFTHGNDLSVSPYTMMWEDSLAAENYTTTGTLATLVFTVAASAQPGTVPITLAVDAGSTYNVNLDDVPFAIQNGSVKVLGQESVDGRFSVSCDEVRPGDSIQVTISADSNPGIVAALLKISYDKSFLTLTNVENGTVFGAAAFTQGNDFSTVPYVLLWEDSLSASNYTSTGVLATLTFTVNDDSPCGETTIILNYDADSTFNSVLNNVPFEVTNGTVLVRLPGDADEDGAVDLQDVVVITRWLAGGWNVTINETNSDVNRDGVVDLKDAVLIRRFLAGGWNVVLR